jgi:DNA-binding response OmpR family regulator
VKILVAEDDNDIAKSYRDLFKVNNHDVLVTDNGNECILTYARAMEIALASRKNGDGQVMPFDVVILDYKMPYKTGLEVAKEILALNPNQRIIFVSAYVKDALEDSVRRLRHAIELVEKPFEPKALMEKVEDTKVFQALKQINEGLQQIVDLDLDDSQQQDLIANLRRVLKGKAF